MSGLMRWDQANLRSAGLKRFKHNVGPGQGSSNERNIALVARFRAGHVGADAELLDANKGLLTNIVMSIGRAQAVPWFEDMMQVAAIGLFDAASDYDHTRGAYFTTWARSKIRPLMQRYLAEMRFSVSIPIDVFCAAFFGHKQAVMPHEGLLGAARSAARSLAIETSSKRHGATPPGTIDEDDLPGYEEDRGAAIDERREAAALRAALAELPERTRDVVYRRFLADEPEELHEIGDSMARPVTRERVRQIQEEGLVLLKKSLLRAGFVDKPR